MVRLLVRLRLRLATNRFVRGSTSDKLVIAWSVLIILAASGACAVLLVAARASSGPGEVRLVVVNGGVLGLWLLPVLTQFAQPVDLAVERLAGFPLTVRQKVAGLLAARFVSVPGLAAVLLAAATIVGYAPAGRGAVLVVALALAQVALCVVVSRSVAGMLEGLSQTRRARDLAVVLVAVLSVAYYLLVRRVTPAGGAGPEPGFTIDTNGWAALSPPGALARGIIDARAGQVLGPLLALGYAAALCALALLGWMTVMRREGSFRPSRAHVRRAGGELALFPLPLRFLPRNRLGAVAAGDLHSFFFRNPRQLYPYIWGSIYPFILGGPAIVRSETGAALLAPYLVYFTGMMGAPAIFQADGPALWQHVVAGSPFRSTIYGKLVARGVVVGIIVAAGVTATCIINRSLLPAAAGIPLGLGTFGIVSGCGAEIAVRNPTAGRRQQGCAPWLLVMLVVEALLLVPGALLVGLSQLALGTLVPGAFAAGLYGALVGLAIVRHAARESEAHMPELLERIARDE